MLAPIGRLLRDLVDPTAAVAFADDDPRLAAAALLAHAVVVDGHVTAAEEAAIAGALARLYGLDAGAVAKLRRAGAAASAAAVDLGPFVAALTRRLGPSERLALVEALWEAACADGRLHEFEEDLLWRVAAPLGVGEAEREALKAKIRAAGPA
jgi:uncharacterized tellurite resistance protein B-like protein